MDTLLWFVRWYEGAVLHVRHFPEGEQAAFHHLVEMREIDDKAEMYSIDPLDRGTIDLIYA